MSDTRQTLVSIRDLKVHFPVAGGLFRRSAAVVQAVDGVSLDIQTGETMGLVGESGCGKTTLGRAILRLTEPTSGQVLFRDRDLAQLSAREMRAHRRQLQVVFHPCGLRARRRAPVHPIGRVEQRSSVANLRRRQDVRNREQHG